MKRQRNKQERIKDYTEKMREIATNPDCEAAHFNADELLCELLEELGYGEVVEVYHEVCKWYA